MVRTVNGDLVELFGLITCVVHGLTALVQRCARPALSGQVSSARIVRMGKSKERERESRRRTETAKMGET